MFTLTKIYRSWEDKNGTPYKSKAGKPYERVSIKVSERGDTWLNGFGSPENQNWKEGDEVDFDIEETSYNGKTYYNFKHKKKGFRDLEKMLQDLDDRVTELEKKLVISPQDIDKDLPF